VPESLSRRLEQQFSPAALVELTSAITWKNYLARFNRVYGVPAEAYPDESASHPETVKE